MHFDLSTMEGRHLVLVYGGVWVVQLGYLGWITFQWLRTPRLGKRDDA